MTGGRSELFGGLMMHIILECFQVMIENICFSASIVPNKNNQCRDSQLQSINKIPLVYQSESTEETFFINFS